jgi:serpin B
MQGQSSSSARGDGWIGATRSYVGELTAQFILPDEGRFDEIADNVASVFADYEANRTSGAAFAVPRFETRFAVELPDAFQALGLTAPFIEGGLLGIADDPRLVIDNVIHETFVEMNEQGTEAAAATIVLVYPTSGPVREPVPVTLDRPFIYRIIDDHTGATLFIGQLLQPDGQ